MPRPAQQVNIHRWADLPPFPMHILFIENHGVFAQTVVEQFLRGHRVVVVPSVLEALEAFRRSDFHVVLIDYDLDDFKGDVFVRRVRDTGSRVPIVATSARDEGNDALLAAGADVLCHKGEFREIVRVLTALVPSPKPTDDDVRAFRSEAPPSIPEAYIEYLRQHGATEVTVGEIGSGFVWFWELSNVLELNVGYGFAKFAPGLFGFASDGAGELYAFDLRTPDRVTVGEVPAVPLDVSEFRVIVDSFELFAEMLSRGSVRAKTPG